MLPAWALDLAIAVLLVSAIFAIYGQTSGFGFVNFDDPDYVTANSHVRAGLSQESITWAFRHSFAGNWFPLTWLSHMLDVQLFGLDGGFHHLTSVGLHAAAAVLLFLFLGRITSARGPSAMVAALFALHPLHVESVAWIAERKDVLSAFFCMLTLCAYARYAARPSSIRYLAALLFFLLGLLAKPMLVTLPLVLLLLDYWPLRRGVRILEKAPFLLLSAIFCVVTFQVHREAGSAALLDLLPFATRVQNALVSYAFYAVKLFWPVNLAAYYPYPPHPLVAMAVLSALGMIAMTILAVRMRHREPCLIVGWTWYVVTLLPVIGLVQVGGQAHADRYTYIPMIGLAIAIVWSVRELLRKHSRILLISGLSVSAVCMILSWQQARYWRDSITLFRHAVAVTTDNSFARFNLAAALNEEGRTAEASEELAETVRIQPNSASARAELGQLLAKQGQLPQALDQFHAAEMLSPRDPAIHYRLATVLAETGHAGEAITEFSQAAQLEPGNADTHYNLATALLNQGRIGEAADEFLACLKLRPQDASAHFGLGITLASRGRTSESIAQLSEAIRIDPRLPGAREALNDVLSSQQTGHPRDH